MDMHEFARRLGAAEGRDPLIEALDALRHHTGPALKAETSAPHNSRGWSTWNDPALIDAAPAGRQGAEGDR